MFESNSLMENEENNHTLEILELDVPEYFCIINLDKESI